MNSKWIREKIQKTRLFSDAQKVQLLVMLDDASNEDKQKLVDGIDVFDREYATRMKKRKQQIKSILGHVYKSLSVAEKKRNQEAFDNLEFGLALLTP